VITIWAFGLLRFKTCYIFPELTSGDNSADILFDMHRRRYQFQDFRRFAIIYVQITPRTNPIPDLFLLTSQFLWALLATSQQCAFAHGHHHLEEEQDAQAGEVCMKMHVARRNWQEHRRRRVQKAKYKKPWTGRELQSAISALSAGQSAISLFSNVSRELSVPVKRLV
jgi:hypothetical protein